MSQISFLNDDNSFAWENSETVAKWLNQVAEKEGSKIMELSYVYCSDLKLLEINKQYLSHDYFTDIITFDLSGHDSSIEGEIYISVERVLDNAKRFESKKELELSRVHVHGLLHLLGYNDHSDSDREMMRNKENHYLSLLPEVPRGTF